MSDIKVIETGQGGDISIMNNDIEVDAGIFNNIYLSWFGGNIEGNTSDQIEQGQQRFDWWGNSLSPNDESRQFNSNLEKKLLTTALTSAGLREIESVAKKDLEHMSSIAEITVTASLIAVDTLELFVLAKEKLTGIPQEFRFIWDDLKRQNVNPIIIESQFNDLGVKFFIKQDSLPVEGVPFVQGEVGVSFTDGVDSYSINALGELIVSGPRENAYFSNSNGEILFAL